MVGASKLYQRSKIEPSGAGISIFLRRNLYRVHTLHASTYHKILSQTRYVILSEKVTKNKNEFPEFLDTE